MTRPHPRVPAQDPARVPCPIAFLAEAPSDEEEDLLQPLVGPAGKVFNAMLRTAGLNREDFWVGNVFDEKLPDNEVANWCAPMDEARKGGFTDLPPIGSAGFLKPEHRHHLLRLRNELLAAQPRVIVPMGNTALWALTGSDSITQRRGAVDTAKYIVPGAKILPTFHPAFIMRQYKYMTMGIGDFVKALREADKGPEVVLPHRRLWIEPDVDDLTAFDAKVMKSDLLSIDIETAFGQITCIGFAPNAEEAICIPFLDWRKPNRSYWFTPLEEAVALGVVKRWCESPVPKLGQNYVGYDIYWLLVKYGIKTRNLLHDTRLIHHALFPELPKDLGTMGANYTDLGPWKTMRKKKTEEFRDK